VKKVRSKNLEGRSLPDVMSDEIANPGHHGGASFDFKKDE
jgi:hypothetical protein